MDTESAAVSSPTDQGITMSAPSPKIKKIGPYILGPICGNPPPVKCMTQYLARRENSQKYYTLKVLTLRKGSREEVKDADEQQGKIMLFTELKMLSRLRGYKGIVQHRGYFKEVVDEKNEAKEDSKVTRLCLVLDSMTNPNDFEGDNSRNSNSLTNLQYYVLKNKRLPESEAVQIFHNMVQIVERLHKDNIVHRDLKLQNFILNIKTKDVILSNFCLGKELISPDQQLTDQRGSPAYIAPEVISGKPYNGKSSDMWALGVGFFTMVFGQFPFFDSNPQELFRKIKANEYKIPIETFVGSTSVCLIKSLLVQNPIKRLSVSELSQKLEAYISVRYSGDQISWSSPTLSMSSEKIQVVPPDYSFAAFPSTSPASSPKVPNYTPSPSTQRVQILSRKRRRETNNFDLEEVLMASATQLEKSDNGAGAGGDCEDDLGLQEVPQKLPKFFLDPTSGLRNVKISKVKSEAKVLTCGDLDKLYAIYVANKAKIENMSSSSGNNQ